MRTLTIGGLCWLSLIAARLTYAESWTGLRAKNPPGIDFSLKLMGQRVYRQGELIELTVTPLRQTVSSGQSPPTIRWQTPGILIEPHLECGSIEKPCPMNPVNKNDPTLVFGISSESLVLPVNRYVPAFTPGRYRMALLSRQLVLTNRGPLSITYGYGEPPRYAISNVVEFEVIPTSPAWVRGAITKSVAVLKGTQPRSQDAYRVRSAAARQLAYLDQPAAWRAAIELFPIEAGALLEGLNATRHPGPLCELLQSRISEPDQDASYIPTMVQICTRAKLPPSTVATTLIDVPRDGTRSNAQADKLRAYEIELTGRAMTTLAGSLPGKEPQAKTSAFSMLINFVQQSRYVQPPPRDPDWLPLLRREFLAALPNVDVTRRHSLLGLYTSVLGGPEVVPLLETVLDAWKPGDYYESAHTALRALYRIDRVRAQSRILAELVKPVTWLDAALLDMLPASVVPAMDNALIDALAVAQRSGGWNPQLRMAALARYATPKALPRVKAIFESQQDPCQPELMAYFLRVDAAYADRVFRSQTWDMQAEPPPCTVHYFEQTPKLAMNGVLEKYLAAYLMHRIVAVKTAAARSLGRYGSASAARALWAALQYFHDYWNGKSTQLAQNTEGMWLEMELRNALARARNWLATEADLRKIQSLCVSEQCAHETMVDLNTWRAPVRIELAFEPDGFRGTVAQYRSLASVEELEVKLGQFPRGTPFQVSAWGRDTHGVAVRIRKLVHATQESTR